MEEGIEYVETVEVLCLERTHQRNKIVDHTKGPLSEGDMNTGLYKKERGKKY